MSDAQTINKTPLGIEILHRMLEPGYKKTLPELYTFQAKSKWVGNPRKGEIVDNVCRATGIGYDIVKPCVLDYLIKVGYQEGHYVAR